MEKKYRIKNESKKGFSLLTEKQMRKIAKLDLLVTLSKIMELDADEFAKKRTFLRKQATFKVDVKKKLKELDSEKMMRNLLAKAVYESSEKYNKPIKSHYAQISEFTNNYRSVKFRRIHKRRYKIYSKKRISYDLLMAYKRVLTKQYLEDRKGNALGVNDDIILTEIIMGKRYDKYEYHIQIIKDWKTAWINRLQVAREEEKE
jgi:hypothetical protein